MPSPVSLTRTQSYESLEQDTLLYPAFLARHLVASSWLDSVLKVTSVKPAGCVNRLAPGGAGLSTASHLCGLFGSRLRKTPRDQTKSGLKTTRSIDKLIEHSSGSRPACFIFCIVWLNNRS